MGRTGPQFCLTMDNPASGCTPTSRPRNCIRIRIPIDNLRSRGLNIRFARIGVNPSTENATDLAAPGSSLERDPSKPGVTAASDALSLLRLLAQAASRSARPCCRRASLTRVRSAPVGLRPPLPTCQCARIHSHALCSFLLRWHQRGPAPHQPLRYTFRLREWIIEGIG